MIHQGPDRTQQVKDKRWRRERERKTHSLWDRHLEQFKCINWTGTCAEYMYTRKHLYKEVSFLVFESLSKVSLRLDKRQHHSGFRGKVLNLNFLLLLCRQALVYVKSDALRWMISSAGRFLRPSPFWRHNFLVRVGEWFLIPPPPSLSPWEDEGSMPTVTEWTPLSQSSLTSFNY